MQNYSEILVFTEKQMPLYTNQLNEVKSNPELQELKINAIKIQYPKPGTYEDVREAMPYISSISLIDPNVSEEKAAIAALEQSDPTNFQQIASTQLELSNSYYTSIRNQSTQSFKWSLITSGIGFVFFLVSIIFLIIELGKVSYFGAAVSAVGGMLVEVYAGLIQGKVNKQQIRQKIITQISIGYRGSSSPTAPAKG
jgi:hypothetical protein